MNLLRSQISDLSETVGTWEQPVCQINQSLFMNNKQDFRRINNTNLVDVVFRK